MFTISVTSAESDSAKVLELTDPYCAAEIANQQVIIQFNESVYLTRMRVSGSSETNFSLYYDLSDMLYINVGGFRVSFYYYLPKVNYVVYLFRDINYHHLLLAYQYGYQLIQQDLDLNCLHLKPLHVLLLN